MSFMPVINSDQETFNKYRSIWAARPELRAVYKEWFSQLRGCVEGLRPVVEVGAGPGFFKEYFPELISTDIVATANLDVVCGGGSLPFRSCSLGALVMVDVLHHLPNPIDFLTEASRVLRPEGRLVLIEPWITIPSYLLYRFFHQEDCSLAIDLQHPFGELEKRAFDGNVAIPFKILKQGKIVTPSLRLVRADPFIGLPYLATLGFRTARSIPQRLVDIARFGERLLCPLKRVLATRILIVWERIRVHESALN
jgi:SAM-dependent methyltransferase